MVPRTRLPDILREISTISHRYQLRIGNVFHAGDGNIHPIVLYDERDADEVRRAIEAGRDILKACVEMGGSLTGEHGIGVEKMAEMPLLFSPDDLHRDERICAASSIPTSRQSRQDYSATRRLRRSRRTAPPGPAVTGERRPGRQGRERDPPADWPRGRAPATRALEALAARIIAEPRDAT